MKRSLFLTFSLLCVTYSHFISGQVKNPTPNPDQLIIEKIQKAGGHVLPIAQNDNRLEVDFHLQSSDVTDQSLVSLEGLKNIYSLNLGKTKITDEGLVHLEGLTSLNRLYLQETHITDKGLVHLKGLRDLVYLNLYGTAVTDQGLANLAGLSNLKNLYLWQTKVTEVGINKLKKLLPRVNIVTGTEPEQKK
jgi:hypothetical protein